MNAIIGIFYTHKGRYGYRRITLELANRGFRVNHKKVKRLMSVMGLYGITPKAKYKSYKGDMDGTVKISCLQKLSMKKAIRLIMKEILKQQGVMRSGQQMYLSFI
ncbi:IS3 family transposase [Absiella sp. AM54-8XD]|uniref:IS3 family transposase n=1 Tax=Absiella sp. AM54-8XD TaxID=2292279 RepID=UPI0013140768|nr:IS3 family transposase [Absiella sp. AM54-8XD]